MKMTYKVASLPTVVTAMISYEGIMRTMSHAGLSAINLPFLTQVKVWDSLERVMMEG